LGTITDVEVVGTTLVVRGKLDLTNPKSMRVYEGMLAGRINEFSVSWSVPAGGAYERDNVTFVTVMELIEVSAVAAGANRGTRLVSVKNAPATLDSEPIERLSEWESVQLQVAVRSLELKAEERYLSDHPAADLEPARMALARANDAVRKSRQWRESVARVELAAQEDARESTPAPSSAKAPARSVMEKKIDQEIDRLLAGGPVRRPAPAMAGAKSVVKAKSSSERVVSPELERVRRELAEAEAMIASTPPADDNKFAGMFDETDNISELVAAATRYATDARVVTPDDLRMIVKQDRDHIERMAEAKRRNDQRSLALAIRGPSQVRRVDPRTSRELESDALEADAISNAEDVARIEAERENRKRELLADAAIEVSLSRVDDGDSSRSYEVYGVPGRLEKR
jgi:hypothetical protein